MRSVLILAATTVLLAAASLPLAAQAAGTVRGTVTETGSGRALSGVQVTVPGTGRSAVTGASGQYLMANVPAGTHRVRAEVIGFATAERAVTVTAGQESRADFALGQQAVALDALVVTGTPGAVSKRTLGNSVTTVDAADVTRKTNVATLTELLQSRSPGVQILPNSGIPGAAADIRIRGASSLTGADPVIFVDGVRYSTAELGNFTPSGAGATSYSGQRTSAFDFINPEDIQSIEIIKGPAAATLYGAEAANGVIQIITKKGARGDQKIQWTARLEQGRNEWSLPIAHNYTTCDATRINERSGGEPVWPGCQGVAPGTVIRGRPLRDDPLALRAGDAQKVSLAMRGGGDRYSFYVAGDHDLNEGVFHNSFNRRRSFRTNFVLIPNDKVEVNLNTAYARSNLRLPVGDESAQGMLLSAFRGRPGRITSNPLNAGWATTRAEQANAYNNQTESDRLTLGSTISVNPFTWFRNRVTFGLDYTASLAQVLSPAGSTDADYAGVREGLVAQRMPRNYVYSFDYAGNVERDLSFDIGSTTSFGLQAVAKRYEVVSATGTGFGAPDVTLIGNAQTQSGSNGFSENKSLGLFVQQQFGWKNRLFVTAGVRADDNSSFGEDFDWIYYPKVSGSWVMSEEPALAGIFGTARLNSFKLRAAYGHAGQAPDPFAADQTYTVDKVVLSNGKDSEVGSGLRTRSLGNPKLVAERGKEYELGFDAGFFDDRAAVEFTYYNKRMNDVIIRTGAAGSTGFGGTFYGGTFSVLKNLGTTLNSGVEVGISATPVQMRAFGWDTRLTLATNRNELVTFGDERVREPISGQSYGSVQEHRVGYPLGGYWVRPPKRDEAGKLILTSGGAVVLDTAVYVGPSAPTREIGFSNTFTLFRDFRVYTQLDYKGGHYLYNYREYARCTVASQLNCERINDPARANDPEAPAWKTPFTYVEKADFVKLRDVSLTYTIPSAWSSRFGSNSASVTVAGHNLALWTDYSGIDPEVNSYGNRNFARTDVYPVPMTRRVSASLNLSF